jgi:hypothetical protein
VLISARSRGERQPLRNEYSRREGLLLVELVQWPVFCPEPLFARLIKLPCIGLSGVMLGIVALLVCLLPAAKELRDNPARVLDE